MSEHPTGEAIGNALGLSLQADRIAFSGIIAICKRLKGKGIFDDDDLRSVAQAMRREVPNSERARSFGVTDAQTNEVDEIDRALNV